MGTHGGGIPGCLCGRDLDDAGLVEISSFQPMFEISVRFIGYFSYFQSFQA